MGTDFVGDGPADLSDLTPPGADPFTVDLNHPVDVQEFDNGDLLVMAWHNHKIRVIDKETGLLARPGCPKIRTEAFVAGTEPREPCGAH
jgi:hypothetical protein